nr:type II toxin-antitoxin system RelE/ParE family toxin [Stenotrophomonas maltophilia]
MGWPMSMPLVRKLDDRLWEVRSSVPEGGARIIFTTVKQDMVLLRGFVKKSPTAPKNRLGTGKEA